MFERLRNQLSGALRGDNENNSTKDEDWEGASPIKLRSTGYQRGADGSVTLSVTLDKDQVECCVCFSSMTNLIFRCKAAGNICHNVCGDCEWQIRRMKSGNGHTKEPKCPICKAEGSFTRNRSLERQLGEISTPCVNEPKGCKHRFFPWDEGSEEEHKRMCLFDSIACPLCNRTITGGRENFVAHLRAPTVPLTPYELSVRNASPLNDLGVLSSDLAGDVEEDDRKENESDGSVPLEDSSQPSGQVDNSAEVAAEGQQQSAERADNDTPIVGCGLPLCEASLTTLDTNKMTSFILGRESTFAVDETHGYVVLCLAPDAERQAWKVYALSTQHYHLLVGNNRVYLQYTPLLYDDTYRDAEANMGLLGEPLIMPTMSTMSLAMNRLQNISYLKSQLEELKSNGADSSANSAFSFNQPKQKNHVAEQNAPLQCGYIFAGTNANSDFSQMRVRLFTLSESFKIGAIIDARDFMGKWYQAEIIKVARRGSSEGQASADDANGVPIRRIKVHYLGYSANYDEWLDVDTDSHRMAQRGTFTVGPDLRALRRYAQNPAGIGLPRVLARSQIAANINEND